MAREASTCLTERSLVRSTAGDRRVNSRRSPTSISPQPILPTREVPVTRYLSPIGLIPVVLAFTATLLMAQDHRELFKAVTPQNFDSGGEVSRQFHLNAESYLRSTTIARGGQKLPLGLNLRRDLASFPVTYEGRRVPFGVYVEEDALLDGVIVLHRGEIVFEAYPNMQPWQRHYAWSVTKVMTSAVLANLVAESLVDMSAAVDRYVPELANTAWAGTSVRDIAHMASGIDCLDSDGYQDTSTCVYRTEEAMGVTAPTGPPVALLEHLQGMGRLGPAGTRNEYVSVNTIVLMLDHRECHPPVLRRCGADQNLGAHGGRI
jgi:hypothetical protein